MSDEPKWLDTELVRAIHEEQLARHGGLPGIRDKGALESAVARAPTAYGYGTTDLFALAAAYAFGIARNHPFNDGNKRTALVASYLFLASNGQDVQIDQKLAETTFLALAAGELSEDALAGWFRERLAPPA